MKTAAQRIDLHHHVFPPDYVTDLARRNVEWTGGAGVPRWSVDHAREIMEHHGIAAAVASSQPLVYWGDAKSAVHWARHSNEFLAGIVRNDAVHFGGFASLPLPDVEAACREVAYALDVLKLDGVLLATSCGPRYLGHPAYEELYQELNRRSAVVFVHPNTAPPGSDVPDYQIPNALVEFTFDTTRCIANLIYSGTLESYPSIRFIMPHAGGTAPFLSWRMGLGEHIPALQERAPKGALHYLQRLYYDTALSTSAPALAALTQAIPASQIVFGSDFPFVTEAMLPAETSGLETSKFLDATARRMIDRDNALQLFPRFAAA
jgi:predicted TIM-barrel fold metal-dependent hydrolase